MTPIGDPSLLRFDDSALKESLERLPVELRVAFAAACAERMLPGYSKYYAVTQWGDPGLLEELLARLWLDLSGKPLSKFDLEERIRLCMRLVPGQDDPWVREAAAAEDAASGVTYALRCRQSGATQEAAWAAGCAYLSVQYYVRDDLEIGFNESDGAQRVVIRQHRDLDELLHGAVLVDQVLESDKRAGLLHRAIIEQFRDSDGIKRSVVLNRSAADAIDRVVVASPLVQAELARQHRDLEELRDGAILVAPLRERAKAEAAVYLPLL